MALVTIFAIITVVMAVKRKEWLLGLVAVITGIMLATTGTEFGTKAVDILTSISKSIDDVITKD